MGKTLSLPVHKKGLQFVKVIAGIWCYTFKLLPSDFHLKHSRSLSNIKSRSVSTLLRDFLKIFCFVLWNNRVRNITVRFIWFSTVQ